ncbi:MAG TPA: hypothetical protein VJT11_01795 [Nitrospiraceae bacterium]|nr:hypothetical protein [Nitrospiraceae bacterium]
MDPKLPELCPKCRDPLAWNGCTGNKNGCSLEKIRAEKRQDPAYQKRSARLTRERLKLFAKPQQKLNLTKEQLQRIRSKQIRDGWKIFHGPVSSWIDVMPAAEVKKYLKESGRRSPEGIRRETSHHVQLTPKIRQAAIETHRAVESLRKQLQASTLTISVLDREISRLCRHVPLRGMESWFRWLVLTQAPPWEFYLWSVELTKLVDPHTGSAVVVQANLSLRPGISKREAKRAAELVSTRWLELQSKKGQPGLTDDDEDVIRTACTRVYARDGAPRHGQKKSFYAVVRAELVRVRVDLNKTTVENRCREFLQEKGMPIKLVTTAKREHRKRPSV